MAAAGSSHIRQNQPRISSSATTLSPTIRGIFCPGLLAVYTSTEVNHVADRLAKQCTQLLESRSCHGLSHRHFYCSDYKSKNTKLQQTSSSAICLFEDKPLPTSPEPLPECVRCRLNLILMQVPHLCL